MSATVAQVVFDLEEAGQIIDAVAGRSLGEGHRELAAQAVEAGQKISTVLNDLIDLDALAFIDKAIDNVIDVPAAVWRSDEVVEMLRELRTMLHPETHNSESPDTPKEEQR